jgi:predicted NACHT family NTPase
LAESGAGKTTALWRIIVENSQAILDGKSEQIPILINLRGWSFQHTCRDLAQEQFGVLGVRLEAVEEELENGKCLLLLDGLNEIPADLRTEAYQDIARFFSNYSENTFVVTCRASDYEPRMLDQEKLSAKVKYPQAYEIRRMGRNQIVDYVRKYFGEDETSANDLLAKLRNL